MSYLKTLPHSLYFFNFEELQDSVNSTSRQTYITQFNAGFMGLSVVCAASAMSNSFTTELQIQARTSNSSTGEKSFPSQDQEGLGAAASDFLKIIVFSPLFTSLFTSLISPTVPKTLFTELWILLCHFFLNYLGRLHTGLPCVSFRHVPWLPRPKKAIFI